ncbi:MAG: DUF58 domain-containing protein [Desulfuromonadaceae bacterium]
MNSASARLQSGSSEESAPQTVRGLQIKAARLTTGIFAGEYLSAFRGRGIEFEEVREYQPGDDVRTIDWNVTARLDRPFVKRFVEERELTLMILLDRSPSMQFGTRRATKLQTAVEAASLLAFAALRSNDKIGLMTYTDRVETYLPASKGKRHVMRLVHQALSAPCGSGGAGMETALLQLGAVLKGRALVFVVSDFHDPLPLLPLAQTALRNDVVAVAVSDPAEEELPAVGLINLVDPETGGHCLVDSVSSRVRDRYRQLAAARHGQIRQQLTAAGAEVLHLNTSISPLHPLIRFFRNRSRQRRG